MHLRQKDFIITEEGLVFAVVLNEITNGRVPSTLRYVPNGENGAYKKTDTLEADLILRKNFPEYVYYCPNIDMTIHAVPLERIKQILKPDAKLAEIVGSERKGTDRIKECIVKLARIFNKYDIQNKDIGITGSVLIENQNENSDIDIVIYGRKNFERARKAIRGERMNRIGRDMWRKIYDRRGLTGETLGFGEYLWCEKRKYNKGCIDGIKFDISLSERTRSHRLNRKYRKTEKVKILCRVTDDRRGFDYPSLYQVDHPEFPTILSFTNTYAGQARKGEDIQVCGIAEIDECGNKQIVVGHSRESCGEYIKIVGCSKNPKKR